MERRGSEIHRGAAESDTESAKCMTGIIVVLFNGDPDFCFLRELHR